MTVTDVGRGLCSAGMIIGCFSFMAYGFTAMAFESPAAAVPHVVETIVLGLLALACIGLVLWGIGAAILYCAGQSIPGWSAETEVRPNQLAM